MKRNKDDKKVRYMYIRPPSPDKSAQVIYLKTFFSNTSTKTYRRDCMGLMISD